MMRAITHSPSPSFNNCELTFLERQLIDLQLAAQQHMAYCERLYDEGLEVVTLTVNSAYPDCAFVEDIAVVLDEVAIICSPGGSSRQNEIEGIEVEIAKYRNIERIALPATLDGGDVLRINRVLYVGRTQRTNALGIESLKRLVLPYGYHVVPVDVAGALHLKTACTALRDDTLLINPAWIDPDFFQDYKIIKVPDTEPFAANILRLPKGILVNAAYPITLHRVEGEGIAVWPIDISEFSKAEAGLTCMSIIFEDDRMA